MMAETQQLEIMEKYIHNTKLKNKEKYERYDLHSRDMQAIYALLRRNIWDAIVFTFNFGMAKGYRMALADMKKGTV